VGRKALPGASSYQFAVPLAEGWESRVSSADTIIFCLAGADDITVLQRFRALGKKVFVFSVLSPVHAQSVGWADCVIALYSYSPASFQAGFSAILGKIPAAGRVPYTIK
jgi:hypothetical protein